MHSIFVEKKILKQHPLVSVIIPAYNSYKYMHDCMNSIVNQTYSNLEIYVIDDSSEDDGTAEILASFNDKRIKHIKTKEKLGLARSLNYGVEISNGEYIARMDADDICHLNRIEKQVFFLESHSDVGIVGCNCYTIDTNNKVVGFIDHPTDDDCIKIKMLFNSAFIHPSVMIRRDVFEPYDVSMRYAEDYELWSRLMFKTKFHNLHERLMKYRILENSAMHSQLNRIKNDDSFYADYKENMSRTYRNILSFYLPSRNSVINDETFDMLLAKRIERFTLSQKESFILFCKKILKDHYPDNKYINDCIGYQWIKMMGIKFLFHGVTSLRFYAIKQGGLYFVKMFFIRFLCRF